MLELGLIGQEDFFLLLLAGVSVEPSPILLHESAESFLELRINDYFLYFWDDGIEVGILSGLIRAYIGGVVLKTS